MIGESQLFFIHCMTPVHIGTGQGVGMIDMPIMRERITNWPYVPASSLKGVLRETYQHKDKSFHWMKATFGSEKGEVEGNAGALAISDSRLLAFPVASMKGTFAYVSCPIVFKRLLRDLQVTHASQLVELLEKLDDTIGENEAIVGRKSKEVLVGEENKAELDESIFDVREDETLGNLVEELSCLIFKDEPSKEMFVERFILVHDEAFQYFTTMCCEVTPRIRINNETMTVEDGALWLEEYLPSESILYGIVWCDQISLEDSQLTPRKLLNELDKQLALQIGGNATVGKGRIRLTFSKEAVR